MNGFYWHVKIAAKLPRFNEKKNTQTKQNKNYILFRLQNDFRQVDNKGNDHRFRTNDFNSN